MSSSERFRKASDVMKHKHDTINISPQDALNLYALFKQATVGDNTHDRPPHLLPEAPAKWDAWTSFKGMST
jgi:diazepam-binding inhibitor (GABA receptor modulating acyl-CoA-binding protein)